MGPKEFKRHRVDGQAVPRAFEMQRLRSLAAANITPTLVWPPIHAAAMLRLGQATQARLSFAEFSKRHPSVAATQIVNRLPGADPVIAEMRERLISSLRDSG